MRDAPPSAALNEYELVETKLDPVEERGEGVAKEEGKVDEEVEAKAKVEEEAGSILEILTNNVFLCYLASIMCLCWQVRQAPPPATHHPPTASCQLPPS